MLACTAVRQSSLAVKLPSVAMRETTIQPEKLTRGLKGEREGGREREGWLHRSRIQPVTEWWSARVRPSPSLPFL